MKKFLCLTLALAMTLGLTACSISPLANYDPDETAEVVTMEKHPLDENSWSDTSLDHADSEYYVLLDYYNLESTDTRIMLTNFETYEQVESYTCGPSSALMTLNYLAPEIAERYTELSIAEICGSTGGGIGTSAGQLAEDFFMGEIGWETDYHMGHDKVFADVGEFIENLVKWNLEDGLPIIVDWAIGGGHWTTIIGYDSMGTDSYLDDVLIFADSSDAADNYKDGYNVFPAYRFFRMWREVTAFDGVEIYRQQYVVPHPDRPIE